MLTHLQGEVTLKMAAGWESFIHGFRLPASATPEYIEPYWQAYREFVVKALDELEEDDEK